MSPRRILTGSMLIILLAKGITAQRVPDGDLALTARASASSEAEGTKAENLTDGINNTQWTAKEGTSPANTWLELSWQNVLQFQEVVIRKRDLQSFPTSAWKAATPAALPRGWLGNRPLPALQSRADRALSAHAILESAAAGRKSITMSHHRWGRKHVGDNTDLVCSLNFAGLPAGKSEAKIDV